MGIFNSQNPAKDRYICQLCSLPINSTRVVSVDPSSPGYISIAYFCECSVAKRRHIYPFSASMLHGLIGAKQLPWKNPHALRPVADDHPDLRKFRWLLTDIKSVEDLKTYW